MLPHSASGAGSFRGNDSALLGIVLAVVTFWLFAQTAMHIGPLMARDLGMPMPVMNIAISLSAVLRDVHRGAGRARRPLRARTDRHGRQPAGIPGSLLIAFSNGAAATPMVILGRILQGLAAGAIMPSTLALLKTYWDGRDRQRAVSMWAIGTWGGSGLAALFGGFMASTALGWRAIFILGALVSVASILQSAESRPISCRETAREVVNNNRLFSTWTSSTAMAPGVSTTMTRVPS